MSRQIFRSVALERLSSPEQLDMLMQVTTVKSWLALGGFALLLTMSVAWGFVGRIPIELSGPVILLNTGGVKNLELTAEGRIAELYIAPGDIVTQGDPVAKVVPLNGGPGVEIVTPYSGRILELKTDVGSLGSPGLPLAGLEFVGQGVELEAIMFVSAADGKSISPGMPIRISPVTVQAEEYGYMSGWVRSVAVFPATRAGIIRTLGSEELMQALVTEPAPIEVRIALRPDEQTSSGYQWSSSAGPDFSIDSGTLGSATITIASERPIDLVLPTR
jgi:hypothetical protein